jgi:cytochrome c biogenesis protein CcmG, thiol:disulfide interchange protein DsbE
MPATAAFVRSLLSRRSMIVFRIPSIVLLCVFVLAFVVPPAFAAEQDSLKPFKLKTLEGEQKTLADVLGPKATLVVFFFPTCRFCNEAFPEIQKLYDTYKARGLSMVWVNAVPKEERLIRAWRAKHGYTVPILVGASIRDIDKDYKVTMTPTHYLLDSQGRIITTHAGYKTGDGQVLEQAIRQALE